MPFTLEITSFRDARSQLRIGHPDHLISIKAPWDDNLMDFTKYGGRLLHLQFVDTRSRSHKDSPTQAHVAEIIEFARGVKEGHLLVHCEMGISRSSAAALIVLATQTGPSQAQEIEDFIYRIRSIACPNNLMLEYADDLLGWHGSLAAMGGWGPEEFGYPRFNTGR